MTGRAAGYCAGYTVPGFMNPVPGGFFWDRGCGGGRGWRNWFYATGSPGWQRAGLGLLGVGGVYTAPFAWPFVSAIISTEQKRELLKRQMEYLTSTLGDIKKRLDELEA
ncbi:MAG: DUF5320 domain-containing protein [Pirellulales bacterium]|nr:DUF5320 domain-containing protein [Pirellulales bacterium]